MKKKCLDLLLFSLISVCCYAQTEGYKFYSQLDSVKQSGFYNIELTPELNSHLKIDYSDLRIVNAAGKWTPHILHNVPQKTNIPGVVVNVEIIKKETANSFTELILKNNNSFLSEFDIFLKNTRATRFAKVSGSDNLNDWFVIQDSVNLEPIISKKDTSKYHIDFPSCNYKFYKILINNKTNDPVNILSVSYKVELIFQNIRTDLDNPSCLLQQYDSNRISYIKVDQKLPYHFEKFKLKISGAKYFYRTIDIYIPTDTNSTYSNPGELYQTFYISNNSALEFSVPPVKTKVFYLKIHNEDNPPLKVEEVVTSININSIIAYLEQGDNYRLIVDNALAETAKYDLDKLNIKLSDTNVTYLSSGPIKAFNITTVKTLSPKPNKLLLWSAIIAALIILLFFTQKMIKEVDKRKQHDNI